MSSKSPVTRSNVRSTTAGPSTAGGSSAHAYADANSTLSSARAIDKPADMWRVGIGTVLVSVARRDRGIGPIHDRAAIGYSKYRPGAVAGARGSGGEITAALCPARAGH